MTSAAARRRRIERLLAHGGSWMLVPAWIAHACVQRLHSLRYDLGWAAVRRLPAPVISVGNLSAGGTGKTPLVEAVARMLADLGRRPAILSRGYRGQDGANDEARLSAFPVFCHRDRFIAGQQALASGADALVLDDGFQHRRLHRDLDLVCVDATRPGQRLLPLGLGREPSSALARAHAIVITRSDQANPTDMARLCRRLAGCGHPVFRTRHAPTVVRSLPDGTRQAPDFLAGRRLVAVAGIGHPRAFLTTLQSLGAQIIQTVILDDHHRYQTREVRSLLALAASHRAGLVATSKDAVKLAPLIAAERGRAWALEVAIEFADDGAALLAQHLAACLARTST